ncbi:hypothetical protein [Streptomyces mirabilis]|uniref:hypothetical protein n=1 Tax=Streptomyces mirabilis TaxID=68239 RepID=UPI0036CCC014
MVTSLRRVYAAPESVAAAADSLVHTGRPPADAHEEEWPQAGAVRAAIDAYRLWLCSRVAAAADVLDFEQRLSAGVFDVHGK